MDKDYCYNKNYRIPVTIPDIPECCKCNGYDDDCKYYMTSNTMEKFKESFLEQMVKNENGKK